MTCFASCNRSKIVFPAFTTLNRKHELRFLTPLYTHFARDSRFGPPPDPPLDPPYLGHKTPPPDPLFLTSKNIDFWPPKLATFWPTFGPTFWPTFGPTFWSIFDLLLDLLFDQLLTYFWTYFLTHFRHHFLSCLHITFYVASSSRSIQLWPCMSLDQSPTWLHQLTRSCNLDHIICMSPGTRTSGKRHEHRSLASIYSSSIEPLYFSTAGGVYEANCKTMYTPKWAIIMLEVI